MKQTIDINTFMWKDQDGKETLLMDMPYDGIQRAYNHTMDMLWNTNQYSPGKYHVKDNIQNMINNCNAELCLRYLLHDREPKIMATSKDVMDVIFTIKKDRDVSNKESISKIFNDIPIEYQSITIDKLIDACFDKLGVVNRKLISDKFILAQGIWLTREEKEDLTETDEKGNRRAFMDVIKERLLLPDIRLRVDPKGLSFAEFKALIKLDIMPKVSSVSTKTLEILRDKIFLRLNSDVDYHINKWESIKSIIEQVADIKHFPLKAREY